MDIKIKQSLFNGSVVTAMQPTYQYTIVLGGSEIYYFSVNMMAACCGTLMLHSFSQLEYLSSEKKSIIELNKQKIFDYILSIANDYEASNITFFDVEEDEDGNEGKIVSLLGSYFKNVHSYKNDNSGNIVNIYTYNI